MTQNDLLGIALQKIGDSHYSVRVGTELIGWVNKRETKPKGWSAQNRGFTWELRGVSTRADAARRLYERWTEEKTG